jgi:hypothetical protein
MTIREYIMRRWRWFPLVLIASIAGAVALYHWVPQTTRLGRTIAGLPLILGLIPYFSWAFAVRCPRCGYNFMNSRGDFWYYTWTSEMVECPKCNLDIDEPMDTPTG